MKRYRIVFYVDDPDTKEEHLPKRQIIAELCPKAMAEFVAAHMPPTVGGQPMEYPTGFKDVLAARYIAEQFQASSILVEKAITSGLVERLWLAHATGVSA